MTGDILVDTNVLVYAFDPRDPGKQARAIAITTDVVRAGQGCLSAQVLAEFFVVVTRRLDPPLSPGVAYDQLEGLLAAWPILPLTPLVPLEAARGVRDHQLSFWDAQLWATARLHQVPVVLSEDRGLGHRRLLEGVRFLDPFASDFELAALLTR
jgi:predicted nucleic acid-binding protein